MKDFNAVIYFSAICGFLCVVSPSMSSTLVRLSAGVVIGFYSWQAWPLIRDILRQI